MTSRFCVRQFLFSLWNNHSRNKLEELARVLGDSARCCSIHAKSKSSHTALCLSKLMASSSFWTYSPHSIGGYLSAAGETPNSPKGSRRTSLAMCPKRVDDTRQHDRSSDLAFCSAESQDSEKMTSCIPAITCPPVSHSNCLPA